MNIFPISDLLSLLFFLLKIALLFGLAVGIIEVVSKRKNPSFTDRDRVSCICNNLFDSLKRYFMALLSSAGVIFIMYFSPLNNKLWNILVPIYLNSTGQTLEEYANEANTVFSNLVDWFSLLIMVWIIFSSVAVSCSALFKLFSCSCFAPHENIKKRKKKQEKAEPTRAIKVAKKTWIVAKNLIKYMVWSGGFVFFYFLSDFFFGNLQQLVVDTSVLQVYINHLQLVWLCLLVYGGFIILKQRF